MGKTIYQKIQDAVESANIKGIVYEEGYPTDHVRLADNPFDKVDELSEEELDEAFENFDSVTPLVKAMDVIMKVIKKEMTEENDVEVCFYHCPFNEELGISIGDGR